MNCIDGEAAVNMKVLKFMVMTDFSYVRTIYLMQYPNSHKLWL